MLLSDKEKIEGNNLIAEHMGWKIQKRDNPNCKNPITNKWESNPVFKYDSSWDCLMPVVFKCHDEGLHFIDSFTHCELHAWCDSNDNLYHNTCKEYEEVIILVWNAVVEFIKWNKTCNL